jgi:DNA repair protein RecO (recombination protein O)
VNSHFASTRLRATAPLLALGLALSLAGWAPSFDACARCGEPGPHGSFVLPMGGLVCDTCAPTGAARLDRGVVDLLAALLSGEWDVVETANPDARASASGVVAAYTQFHLERGLRSLEHVI